MTPNKEVWCEHITWFHDYRDAWAWWFRDAHHTYLANNWHLCPICGAPRPVEKTLEEKFRDYFHGRTIDGTKIDKEMRYIFIDILSDIAHNHFKGDGK